MKKSGLLGANCTCDARFFIQPTFLAFAQIKFTWIFWFAMLWPAFDLLAAHTVREPFQAP